jgi:hypothetical protein
MPDFFDGEPADISWYPPDNKEKEEKLGNFFSVRSSDLGTSIAHWLSDRNKTDQGRTTKDP